MLSKLKIRDGSFYDCWFKNDSMFSFKTPYYRRLLYYYEIFFLHNLWEKLHIFYDSSYHINIRSLK